tara:strand:+ start:4679 stop:5125 length:447 start_codon:yes stop_codon:yes gene_type:complete
MSFLVPAITAIGPMLTTAAPYIAAAGTAYSAYQNIQMGNQQADISTYQAQTQGAALAERADERKRRLRKTVGAQRALYASSGVGLEGTPTDVFEQTAKEFAYEDYADRFDTLNNMGSKYMEADAYRSAGKQKAFGNLLDFGISWGMRG